MLQRKFSFKFCLWILSYAGLKFVKFKFFFFCLYFVVESKMDAFSFVHY
jgi:hypothetical protein